MINNTLSERIFEQLKHDILAGIYKPGDRLLYEMVASKLGVSLTPVKEALLRLEQEGLVKTMPRKGCHVTQLTNSDIVEYTRIRLALECLAVELICEENCNTSGMAALRKINSELEIAIETKNPDMCMEKDFEFHQTLIEMSGSVRLRELMNQMPLSNFFALMGAQNIMIERGPSILIEHSRILETLSTCDAEKTKAMLRENILTPQMSMLKPSLVAHN